MRRLVACAIASLLLALPAVRSLHHVHAQSEYFVDKNSIGGSCSDDGPGDMPTTPWCTIAKANRTLGAGDTVLIRTGEYAETIAPLNDGTEHERLVYDTIGGGPVVLADVGTAISIVGRAYITVGGIDVERVDRYLTLDNSHHILIGNVRFQKHNNTGGWPTGVVFRNNSHHNRLIQSEVGGVGYSTADDDKGCVMNLGVWENADDHSDHNLLEDNTFYHGGHHVLAISSNHNVIRNNYFHNENWMDCEREETGRRCGNRSIIFEYDASNVAWNVVEGNRFAASGVPPDQNTSAALSVRTPHNIIRRNAFYASDGPGVDVSTLTGLWDARDNHIYHNNFYHNGFTALPGVEHWKQAGMLVAHHGQGAEITGLGIKNNIFHGNKTHGIMFYYTDRESQVVAGNWEEAGDPGFTEPSLPSNPNDRTLPDFGLLPGSPCIDEGVFLTETTSAGSGTEIPVGDAGYFSDGREIVDGDVIQLEGGILSARIVSIDYERNVLTVSRAMSWEGGQGVSQFYAGSAPDIGAHEYLAAGPPPTRTPTRSAPTASATSQVTPADATAAAAATSTATATAMRTPGGPKQVAIYLPFAE